MAGEKGLDVAGEFQEPKEVRNGGSIFACTLSDLIVAKVELLVQAIKGVSYFNRVQILALDVLDERDLHEPLVCEVLNDDGHVGERSQLRGAPAALSGDELISVSGMTDDDGLDDSVLSDGLGEFGEALRIEYLTRLKGVGLDLVQGQ